MRALSLAVIILAAPAYAHFVLISPGDWLDVGPLGDPTGGSQKTPPCDEGTSPTGTVTTLQAGAQLAVQWKETVPHDGWYRIALARDRANLPGPDATLNCTDAGFERTAVFPVLADGINLHDATSNTFMVTVPNGNCDACTLQVSEFMLNHGGNCYYWHCANVKIVGSDAGELMDDGGMMMGGTGGGSGAGGGSAATGGGSGTAGGSASTGGGSGASGGGSGATGGGSGATGGAGATGGGTAAAGGGAAAAGGGSSATGGGGTDAGGCTCSSADAALLMFGSLLTLLRRRRRN
jgi:MYXO-CTERM domain-containing protein